MCCQSFALGSHSRSPPLYFRCPSHHPHFFNILLFTYFKKIQPTYIFMPYILKYKNIILSITSVFSFCLTSYFSFFFVNKASWKTIIAALNSSSSSLFTHHKRVSILLFCNLCLHTINKNVQAHEPFFQYFRIPLLLYSATTPFLKLSSPLISLIFLRTLNHLEWLSHYSFTIF